MSLVTEIHLECDGYHCNEYFSTRVRHHPKTDEADKALREAARKKGWHTKGNDDYCAVCAYPPGCEGEQMKYRFMVWDNDGGETDRFETMPEVREWLANAIEAHHSDGVGEEAMDGGIGWAEIKQVTKWVVTDKKSNYPEGEWPHNPDWDEIGELRLVDAGGYGG